MSDLSDIDKLIRQQTKYLFVERVCCPIFGILSAAAGALFFLFVDRIAGSMLFAVSMTFLFWARTQKKLTQRLLTHLNKLYKS